MSSASSLVDVPPPGVPVHKYIYAGRVLCWTPASEDIFATKDDSFVTCATCLRRIKHLVQAA